MSDDKIVRRSDTKHLKPDEKEQLLGTGLAFEKRKSPRNSPTSSIKSDSTENLSDLFDENSEIKKLKNTEVTGNLDTKQSQQNFNLLHIPNIQIMAEETYNVKLRHALEMVPLFSGDNDCTSFENFVAGCQDAQNMLPATAEKNLTILLRTKLRGSALQLLRGTSHETLKNFLKALQDIFSPKKTSTELCGELTRLNQNRDELVAHYFNRAKQLQNNLIEAHKVEHDGIISPERKREWEQTCAKYFILGLNKDLFPLMKQTNSLDEAGPEAIELENVLKNRIKIHANNSCSFCNSTNHNAEVCPLLTNLTKKENDVVECQLCKRKGHKASECKNCYFCQLCNEPGHTAIACRPITPIDYCQLCKKTGHNTKNCHFATVNVTRPTIICRNCKKPGHIASQCLQNIECYACNKRGHYAKDCRSTPLCWICKTKGHSPIDCKFRNKSNKPIKQCSYCNKFGHEIGTCFIKNNYDKFTKTAPGNSVGLPPREAHKEMTVQNYQ